MTWMKRLLLLVGIALLCTYLLFGALLYTAQDSLIYPAPQISRAELDRRAALTGASPIDLIASDGTALYGWHMQQGGDRALIFFHGNGATVEAAPWFAQHLPGWDVISVAYRGYPGSEGSPSQAGLALDARATWDYVTETLGIPPERIVVQGQSLGGGVAHLLLEHVTPKAVVFDSTFLSIEHLAKPYGWAFPVSLLLKSPFRSYRRAPNMQAPTLVLHGDADTLIPVSHGREHAKLLPHAEYIELPGKGHGHWMLDDPTAHRAWKRFLDAAIPPE